MPFRHPVRLVVSDTSSSSIKKKSHNHAMWESEIERDNSFEILDLLSAQADIQRFYVIHQVFNFPTTNNGEDVGCFLHHVCDGD